MALRAGCALVYERSRREPCSQIEVIRNKNLAFTHAETRCRKEAAGTLEPLSRPRRDGARPGRRAARVS